MDVARYFVRGAAMLQAQVWAIDYDPTSRVATNPERAKPIHVAHLIIAGSAAIAPSHQVDFISG